MTLAIHQIFHHGNAVPLELRLHGHDHVKIVTPVLLPLLGLEAEEVVQKVTATETKVVMEHLRLHLPAAALHRGNRVPLRLHLRLVARITVTPIILPTRMLRRDTRRHRECLVLRLVCPRTTELLMHLLRLQVTLLPLL
jgi:hypothetical protein